MEIKKLGRFEILEEIGSGGMGIVYKGRDPKINRHVALKVIRPQMSSKKTKEQKQAADRFYVEAQAAGQLSHHNIVTIYDVGEEHTREGDLVYIAMEFLDGHGLDYHISESTYPTLKEKINIVKQIARGLDYAHKRGVIHRDVKPANIIVTEGNVPKLTDFGLARLSDSSLTLAGTILGTPNYMSPEQVQGKKVDARSDFFALTVIFYEMLTGEKPFGADSITSVIYRVVNDDPLPPRRLRADLPPSVDAMIKKGLSKKPDDRYQSGAEYIKALDHILKEAEDFFPSSVESTIELEPKRADRARRAAEPARGLYAAAAGAAALAILLGLYYITSVEKPAPAKERMIAKALAPKPSRKKPEALKKAELKPPANEENTALEPKDEEQTGKAVAQADKAKQEKPKEPEKPKQKEPVKTAKAPPAVKTKSEPKPPSAPKEESKAKPAPKPASEPKAVSTPPVEKPKEKAVPAPAPTPKPPAKMAKARPPKPLKYGYLDIDSEPNGADVFINDKYVGLTPVNNFKFPQGEINLQVKKKGYVTVDKTIEVGDDKKPITIALLKGEEEQAEENGGAITNGAVGKLEIYTPPGSVIFVDGREYREESLTLGDLSTGTHLVYIQVKGRKPYNERVVLKAGERKKIDIR